MKLRTVCILVLLALTLALMSKFGYAADRRNRIFEVTINTHTATLGGGQVYNRVYYRSENQSTSYDMKRATWPLEATDAGSLHAANGGWWEDKYNVYQSSWYYILTGGGPANVTEYTGTLVYQERD